MSTGGFYQSDVSPCTLHTQWKVNTLANSTRPLLREQKRAYLLKQATKSHPLERISNRRRSTQNDKRRQRRIQEAASNCIIRLSPGNENKKRLAAKKHRFCIQYSDNGREVNFKQMGLEPDWGSVNQGFKICGGWKSVDVHFIFSKYSQLIGDWLWFDYKPGCEPLKMGDKWCTSTIAQR